VPDLRQRARAHDAVPARGTGARGAHETGPPGTGPHRRGVARRGHGGGGTGARGDVGRFGARRRVRAARGRRSVVTSVTTASALTAQEITVRFGGLVAVNSVSFDIPRGGIVSLIGPNGAGKTTFFNALTGLYKLAEGRVVLGDRDITGLPPHKIARLGVARTFQNIRLFGLMTAEENVKVAMHAHLRSGVVSTIIRTPRQRREEREAHDAALELLDFVG